MTNEILKEFEEANAILRGHFILSSGLHSDTYLQCARVFMNPARAQFLCEKLANRVREKIDINDIDMVVAPAMGGVIIGYEMGRQLDKDTIFCERENGQFTFRRGFEINKDDKILLVEDVLTTGKSSLEAAKTIEEHGGVIVAEACLVDRSCGKAKLDFPLISLLEVEVKTFEENDVPDELKDIPAVKPGSRWLGKAS